jgi:hypothetical protein
MKHKEKLYFDKGTRNISELNVNTKIRGFIDNKYISGESSETQIIDN